MAESHIMLIVAFIMAHLAVAQQLEAAMELGSGLSPRYFLGQALRARQDSCGDGNHPCNDVGSPGSCCRNDYYCYIDPSASLSCCPLGSNCKNLCIGTGTSTDTIARYLCTTTASVSGVAVSTSSCCGRPCPTDAYLCASSLGGHCCPLGSSCATTSGSARCVSTVTTPVTLVPVIPSGCIAGQSSCTASEGGGCCYTGSICSASDGTLYCVNGTTGASAIRTGPDGTLVSGIVQTSPTPDSGLSAGAKAGIGVGIAVVICLIIAGLLWFCMKQRNASRAARSNSRRTESIGAGQTMSQGSGNAAGHHGMAGYFDAAAGSYTDDASPGSVPHRGVPLSPDGPGDIIPPVEIGHSREHSNVTSPGPISEHKPDPETVENRIELP